MVDITGDVEVATSDSDESQSSRSDVDEAYVARS